MLIAVIFILFYLGGNAAKYFIRLHGDTDTSISEFHSYVTEKKAVIME